MASPCPGGGHSPDSLLSCGRLGSCLTLPMANWEPNPHGTRALPAGPLSPPPGGLPTHSRCSANCWPCPSPPSRDSRDRVPSWMAARLPDPEAGVLSPCSAPSAPSPEQDSISPAAQRRASERRLWKHRSLLRFGNFGANGAGRVSFLQNLGASQAARQTPLTTDALLCRHPHGVCRHLPVPCDPAQGGAGLGLQDTDGQCPPSPEGCDRLAGGEQTLPGRRVDGEVPP